MREEERAYCGIGRGSGSEVRQGKRKREKSKRKKGAVIPGPQRLGNLQLSKVLKSHAVLLQPREAQKRCAGNTVYLVF